MRDTRTVTVCTPTPIIEEGRIYPFVDGGDQPTPGEYRIEIELNEMSAVSMTDTQVMVRDLTTVKVLGAYQVAF